MPQLEAARAGKSPDIDVYLVDVIWMTAPPATLQDLVGRDAGNS
jgi:hypothetical protein